MSARWTERAWALPSSVGGSTRLMLLALADAANHEGLIVGDSIGCLAQKCGVSPRQAYRILALLREQGRLVIHRRPGGLSVYELTFSGAKKLPSTFEATMRQAVAEERAVAREADTPDTDVTPDTNVSPDTPPPLSPPPSPTPPSPGSISTPDFSPPTPCSPPPSRVPPSQQRWMEHEKRRNEAIRSGDPVKMHHFVFPNTRLVARDRRRLQKGVKPTRHCVSLFYTVLEDWNARGWNPLNVRGMLERLEGELRRCPEDMEEWITQ